MKALTCNSHELTMETKLKIGQPNMVRLSSELRWGRKTAKLRSSDEML